MSTPLVLRVLLAAALTSQCATPVAAAVSPPPVDQKWLPAAALPSPPEATVQREICTIAAADASGTDVPAQLTDVDLPRIWQL
ncbi:MAG: rane-anchored mycosin, partial [Mycobacterium sp.]|nr:rane-anchored mycosin [Mycobacterium sp.]